MCALAKSLQSCLISWTVACQAPLSMGFSRQEYWSGFPCRPPGDLPYPGIKSTSLVSHISCTGRRVLYHLCHLASPLEKSLLAIIMFRGGGDWSSVCGDCTGLSRCLVHSLVLSGHLVTVVH